MRDSKKSSVLERANPSELRQLGNQHFQNGMIPLLDNLWYVVFDDFVVV